ncbi:unnamed protein product [Ambrosiozyma monospora]|uniref:Unnamed protein product n=1 Tax=Ambrosiozyma monospora TaxID=43982 RepID=A0ACB5TL57_AMBMO|nr:unnamed protein product [Ambrosiozyma monospora]
MSTSGSMYSQNQESPASGPNAAVSNVRSDSNHSNNGSFSSTIFDIHIYQLSDAQLDKFDELIPGLKEHPDYTKEKLEMFLRTYWKFFHPRFPILHRPSFNSLEMPPVLLLSMFILGCKLSMCIPDKILESEMVDPKSLADKIALPLRWLLFASPDFQPPAKIWIIQSLLMLEFYEKNCSTRQLHERSHLHHGTTIQLLRRSPTLGGSPHKSGSIMDNADSWYKWIEVESLKRATYMCFYIDAIDAISFGHQMLIYAHQIQMTMPAEDALWESSLHSFNQLYKKHKKPQPFLLVLKNILNGQPTRTNAMGKKVLLAGLAALMFQIQQRDLQLSFGLDKFGMSDTVNNWRELLTAAFTIWRNDVGGSCCSSKTAIENIQSLGNTPQFSTSDTRCKCITYHMAHVYMSISLYDLFIFAGAPWRMSVKPSELERQQIAKRVSEWCDTRHAKVCVVQCYLLLFEMFLSPQDAPYEYQYDYLPDADLFFRSNVIGLCSLVIWSYNSIKSDASRFHNGGRLSRSKSLSAGPGPGPQITIGNNTNINNISVRPVEEEEEGYRYLKRVRKEFTVRSGDVMLHTASTDCSGSQFYGHLVKWIEVLDDIPCLDNMVGLLDLVGTKLSDAQFTVGKEIGKLLLFCKERSQGSEKTVLEDMYE